MKRQITTPVGEVAEEESPRAPLVGLQSGMATLEKSPRLDFCSEPVLSPEATACDSQVSSDLFFHRIRIKRPRE